MRFAPAKLDNEPKAVAKRGETRVKTVVSVIGTRPEVIKVAPVILELQKYPEEFRSVVLATAQHRDMLDQMLGVFSLTPDRDLDVMTAGQSLTDVTNRVLSGVGEVLDDIETDLLLVQGDTTTTFVSALAAFYRRVPVGHIEAGLRTFKRYYPFPEEINRCLTSRLASLHFAPTKGSAANLRAEGIAEEAITITGNTVIDALDMMVQRPASLGEELEQKIAGKKLIALTAHRRENFGAPVREALGAIGELVDKHPDVCVVYPVHPNPNVRNVAEELLGGRDRIHLIAPLEYEVFCHLMHRATLLITDSGGVQEEGPHLGKPVLVMRDETERPEAVDAGTVKLVGCHRDLIIDEATALLTDAVAYSKMAQAINPYGDGHSAERHVETIRQTFASGGSLL